VDDVEEVEEVEEAEMEEAEMDSDEDYNYELPDLLDPVKKPPPYAVGSFFAAVYDRQWFIAQVEGEEPEN